MILNISGRCDIVAFYTPWFLKRIKEGFVDVRNPFYFKQVSRIYFKDVELFVFCTKNPLPILPYLKNINKPILFQVTLTPYLEDIEPNVKNKKEILLGIKKLSEILGKENVYVRYDPILINEKYTFSYHEKSFFKLCQELQGKVEHIILSFVDDYKNVAKNASYLQMKKMTTQDFLEIGKRFGPIAKQFSISLQLCFENVDLSLYGITNTPCISKELAYQKTGKKYSLWKARKCGCVEMVDIGAYNMCPHLCRYCYANYEEKKVFSNLKKHNPSSTMIYGELQEDDVIKVRRS